MHLADATVVRKNCSTMELLELVKKMSARKRGPRKGAQRYDPGYGRPTGGRVVKELELGIREQGLERRADQFQDPRELSTVPWSLVPISCIAPFHLTTVRATAHTRHQCPQLYGVLCIVKVGPYGPGRFTSSFCDSACRGLLFPSAVRIAGRVGRCDRRGRSGVRGHRLRNPSTGSHAAAADRRSGRQRAWHLRRGLVLPGIALGAAVQTRTRRCCRSSFCC